MFGTLPAYTHALTTYTPHVSSPLSSSPLRSSPSPLSPRDANLPAREPDLEMSSPTPASRTTTRHSQTRPKSTPSSNFKVHSSETPGKNALPSPPPSRGRAGRESVYSKRVTKSNPLMNRNADEGREARRKLFLKRVREGSEEKRWRDRNSGFGEGEDEMLRSIWVAEERRREESRRREAMGIVAEVGDEEDDVDVSFDEVMADEVAMKEEQELEALLGSLSQPQEDMDSFLWDDQVSTTALRENQSETPYGSDDEEYDHIFLDVIEEENRMASLQQQHLPGYLDTDHEMMDMS